MTQPPWWQTAVFYQVYPRSFADGNGDGIGDLPGLIDRLDYLQALGVDALWLSPHYPSPQFDCGYDVSDYTAVAPEQGTLADFKRLVHEAHARGLRLILDLVLNHTSDQHPWFQESRASRDNPRRDWYVWRDGAAPGQPPNNWVSGFGGSAWTLDPATGQYYYHYFFAQQPDLNWRNPAVQQAMFDVMRFWFNLGVDGFRLDAIGTLFEHPALPDNSVNTTLEEVLRLEASAAPPDQARLTAIWRKLFEHQGDQPGIHEMMRALRRVADEFPGRVLVGETDDLAYHGAGDELHLVFNFPLMRTDRLTPDWVRANQAERLAGLLPGAWPCNTLGNHDSPRVYSRYGSGDHAAELARLAAALMLTLQGTPFLYNGEEIGMTDWLLTNLDQFRDMIGVWRYHVERDVVGRPPAEALARAARFSRDKCRTPMQWGPGPGAGFCPAGVQPWLPINPNADAGVNVAQQAADPGSLLNFYRRLLAARRATPALQLGRYAPWPNAPESCLAFTRTLERSAAAAPQACLVVLSFAAEPITWALSGLPRIGRVVFGEAEVAAGSLHLPPFAVFVTEVQPGPVSG